jgi:DNA-binding transcriptional LysR family regulator
LKKHLNIPIEILRSIISVNEMGSLSKAAAHLGLTQPAISAQLKRIELLIGGPIFSKTPNGSVLTNLGSLVIVQARKILEGNDQLLAIGGVNESSQPLRIGLSTILARKFMAAQSAQSLQGMQVHSDNSPAISKLLIDGSLDIGCLFYRSDIPEEIHPLIVNEHPDQLVWARSEDFTIGPGEPIPILTWTGDDWVIRTLLDKGLSYRIVFNGEDYGARQSGVEAGVGILALPKKQIPPSLQWAREPYLPELPLIKGVLCARPGLQSIEADRVLKQLSSLFFENSYRPNSA